MRTLTLWWGRGGGWSSRTRSRDGLPCHWFLVHFLSFPHRFFFLPASVAWCSLLLSQQLSASSHRKAEPAVSLAALSSQGESRRRGLAVVRPCTRRPGCPRALERPSLQADTAITGRGSLLLEHTPVPISLRSGCAFHLQQSILTSQGLTRAV